MVLLMSRVRVNLNVALLLYGSFATSVAFAQSAEPQPALSFDVASVRPSGLASQGGISRPVNGTVRVNGAPLRRIIQFAYDIEPELRHDPLPVGGPSWIDDDLFVIEARGPADLSLADARRMMQSLLRERFNLRAHIEKKELPVYVLVRTRADSTLGPGLRRSQIDCAAYSEALARSGRLEVASQVGPRECGFAGGGGIGGGRLFLKGTGTLADMLRYFARSPDIDRRILDRTGLAGTFDVDFVWAPDRSGPAAAVPADVVSIFTALPEQLGLKLESRREVSDVVVIDTVERPGPN
jgi:uncharacterized protein (TIGR03435 family)